MPRAHMLSKGVGLQLAITVTCQLSFILLGYDQCVLSGIVGNDNFLDVVNHPSPAILGIIVSIFDLGCFAGSIISFFINDKIGPRRCIWLAMAWIIIGATLQCSSYSRAQLLAARFITGMGTGLETTTVPVYQSELCEAKHRGKLVCSELLFVAIGVVVSYWFDYGMSFVQGSISWRLPIACQMIFAVLIISSLFGLPESPRFLYRKGRNEEAIEVLCDVYNFPPNDEKIKSESRGIMEAMTLENVSHESKWTDVFRGAQTRKRVLLAYGMQFMNQMGGINFVVYYMPSVLQFNVGVSRNMSLLLGGAIEIMLAIGSLYPTFYSDRVGRRKTMMWGCSGLCICMMMIAILLSFKGTSVQKPTASASIAFLFLYMLIFGASVNCVPWVYTPEILPLKVRAKGQAISIAGNWTWNFFVVMIAPTLIEKLAWKAYLIFMAINFAFVPIVYFFYPETANLTLEEIDFLFPDSRGTEISNAADKESSNGSERDDRGLKLGEESAGV